MARYSSEPKKNSKTKNVSTRSKLIQILDKHFNLIKFVPTLGGIPEK